MLFRKIKSKLFFIPVLKQPCFGIDNPVNYLRAEQLMQQKMIMKNQ